MNWGIGDLQSPALPLGYGAVVGMPLPVPISPCVESAKPTPLGLSPLKNENLFSLFGKRLGKQGRRGCE